MKEGSETRLVIEEAVSMIPKSNGYIFVDIAGRKYEIDDVVIESIDFIGHKVVLRKIQKD